jgi:hypothetical protein
MAIELAYSVISSSTQEYLYYTSNTGQSLAADAAIEIAVSIINNRTDVLPNIFVDIVRVNNRDPSFASNTEGNMLSKGYTINQIYETLTNETQKKISPIILGQGGDLEASM